MWWFKGNAFTQLPQPDKKDFQIHNNKIEWASSLIESVPFLLFLNLKLLYIPVYVLLYMNAANDDLFNECEIQPQMMCIYI